MNLYLYRLEGCVDDSLAIAENESNPRELLDADNLEGVEIVSLEQIDITTPQLLKFNF